MRVAYAALDGRFLSVWEIERSVDVMFKHFARDKISQPVGKDVLFGEPSLADRRNNSGNRLACLYLGNPSLVIAFSMTFTLFTCKRRTGYC